MPKVSLCQNRVPLKPCHKHSQGRYSMLEPDEGKPSRPVLRRGDGSNSASLAGVVQSSLYKNLLTPSGPGTSVQHEAEQGQPMDSCPPPCPAGGAAHPWRCPRPLVGRPGAAARHLGGRRGHRCHTLGGGADAPGRRARRRAGVPPFAHDGTERRIVCPQDPAQQTACYSGKKKDHTVKNVLLVNALLTILFLSHTYGGRVHDK